MQPCFQKLFDCDEEQMMFKWLNANCFTDMDANQNRPDGCAENDHKAIGYFEVKPMKHAKNHNKINIDWHRLCPFSKAGTAKYQSKHMFQVMAVGKFRIIKIISCILNILFFRNHR